MLQHGLDAVYQIHSRLAVHVKCCLLAGEVAMQTEEQHGCAGCRECCPAHVPGWSFSSLGQKSGMRHHRLAAPGAPGWGHSPPWTPPSSPRKAVPVGADARGSPFPAGAEEVQTISPLVMLSVWTHLTQTSPWSQAHRYLQSWARVCVVSSWITGVQSPRSHFLL